MDDTTRVYGIFGEHPGRSATHGRLTIRDSAFIADLKARLSGVAAADNRARDGGWSLAFSPTRIDGLTERSLFEAVLSSARHGERRLGFAVASDWVEIGGGAMESSVRGDPRNLQMALEKAFGRAVVGAPDGAADRAAPPAVRP